MVVLGLEQLILDPPKLLAGQRLGLLCNQASTDRKFRHSRDLINQAFPGQLTCIFSPQHGFFAEKQDNMVESDHMVDPATGVKVFSLYGALRKPDQAMFDHLDILLIDLNDVGTRVYTFIYTVAYCLEAAAAYGKQVVVLDRPNPIGGLAVEGNLLTPDCASFVGLYPIPMRHGLTLGELAILFNRCFGINAALTVIPMRGWQRSMLFRDTGLPWLLPSPNMPTPETALVYPGQVLWEGTNISEGRGTTLPFELCGAPFFEPGPLLDRARQLAELPGCLLRPLMFEPTSNKWAGQTCAGFHIHVTEPAAFRPYRTSLALLQAAIQLYPEQLRYKEPPYEYEFTRLPLDLILGDTAIRAGLEQGAAIADLEAAWQTGLDDFDRLRQEVLLYR